jgi:hypothetical protein
MALAFALALAGCDVLGLFSGGHVQLKTDRSSYAPDTSTTIRLTATNRYNDSVYYICAGDVFLEELRGGEPVNTWKVHGHEECLARSPIAPDASRTFDMPFKESYPLSFIDEARFDESVRYRFRLQLYESKEVERLLDKSDRLSNTIAIIRPTN